MSSETPSTTAGATGTITIDDAIERLGYGNFQRRVLVAAGLCFAADAMEVLLLSFLSIVLQGQWDLSSQEMAVLTSIVFLGQFLGTIVLGPLGDKIGRKPVFMIAALTITIFGFATALCSNFISLVLVRMLVGVGVGGLVVPFDGMAELLPIKNRGRDLLFIEYFWTIGTLSVPLMAYLTLDNNNIDGWRYFVALCALPCLLSVATGFWLVPESPRWLLTKGRDDKAMEILRQAATINGLDAYTTFPESMRLRHEEPEAAGIKDLFTPSWRWITLSLWITWAGFAFLYYGTILTTTYVFSDSTVESQDGTFTFDYGAIVVSGSAEFFGTTFAILMVDRIGRVRVQMVSYFIGGVCVLLLSLTSGISDDPSRGALMLFAFFARMFMMAGNITTWVNTAEILTTEIRTTGHSAANAMARLGGFCAPYLVQETTSPIAIGLVMFGLSLITTATSSRLPETKGKALGVHLNHPEAGRQGELEMQAPDGAII